MLSLDNPDWRDAVPITNVVESIDIAFVGSAINEVAAIDFDRTSRRETDIGSTDLLLELLPHLELGLPSILNAAAGAMQTSNSTNNKKEVG
mmetsp:Transcript_28357/g.46032  ORF Transcript_28357/g.46032 Transcript_28357/m.46032 type:complete len:91 (+) Transcript_28357:938-1210(+)